jgi:hypothetical protein
MQIPKSSTPSTKNVLLNGLKSQVPHANVIDINNLSIPTILGVASSSLNNKGSKGKSQVLLPIPKLENSFPQKMVKKHKIQALCINTHDIHERCRKQKECRILAKKGLSFAHD